MKHVIASKAFVFAGIALIVSLGIAILVVYTNGRPHGAANTISLRTISSQAPANRSPWSAAA